MVANTRLPAHTAAAASKTPKGATATPFSAAAAGMAEPVSVPEAPTERAAPPAGAASPGPAARPRGPPGTLVVNTEPWSRVTIDGRYVGQTPLPAVPLSPGPHVLVCTNPDTGLSHRETVVIPPGGRIPRFIHLAAAR